MSRIQVAATVGGARALRRSDIGRIAVGGRADLAVLETDGVIGWVVQRSLFQRRVGLATLVATTAAGSESVDILDMPWRDVPAFIRAATPRPVEPFLS